MGLKKKTTLYTILDKEGFYFEGIYDGIRCWNVDMTKAKMYTSYSACQNDRDILNKDAYIMCVDVMESVYEGCRFFEKI